ncbi:hypothetical protein T459_27756 [Capsicum annuum]|uniref:glutathione transferase n=1 Tax=Capsicum annuum TaxID=4072 RepID=A0A2G2YEY8_CAPAN|nr:hypothetical protein T459_27756 [Capsicum annuum]
MIYVNVSNKPKWFPKVNPEGKVPVINFGDKWISDSDVIVGLLDSLSLLPRICLCVPFNLHGPHGVSRHLKYLLETNGSNPDSNGNESSQEIFSTFKDVNVVEEDEKFQLEQRILNFEARTIFDRMQSKDVVSWIAILDMYVQLGELVEACRVLDEMPERNEIFWRRGCESLHSNGPIGV